MLFLKKNKKIKKISYYTYYITTNAKQANRRGFFLIL